MAHKMAQSEACVFFYDPQEVDFGVDIVIIFIILKHIVDIFIPTTTNNVSIHC